MAERLAQKTGKEFDADFVLEWIKLYSESFSEILKNRPETMTDYDSNPNDVLDRLESELYEHGSLEQAA